MPLDNYGYLGTQDQTSGANHFNLISYITEQNRNQISTATLVRIVRAPYDASGNAITPGSAVAVGYVDVLPLVNQIDGYGNATPHGTVYHLSYYRYQGGTGAIIIDPVVGDIGKMVVAERDTSAVKATGMQSNPGSRRMYDRADGTYFGCTQGAAPTQYVAFTGTGVMIADKNGNSIVTSPSGIIVADINGNIITTSSAGVTVAVKSGGVVKVDSGGVTQPVKLADGSDSIVLMAQ